MNNFNTTPGFCSDCGSILPLLRDSGKVTCYLCNRQYGIEAFGDMEFYINIECNTSDAYVDSKTKKERKAGLSEKESDGPVVERRCPKCNNDKMSYATLQLRSADEGQTVFYTCTNCKYKETENS
uniref:DNA-directed RNA polymerase subunit n=1 Tax=Xenopsylla cheopis TaxID=163159 RepID=A0A6M2DL55_XENCH